MLSSAMEPVPAVRAGILCPASLFSTGYGKDLSKQLSCTDGAVFGPASLQQGVHLAASVVYRAKGGYDRKFSKPYPASNGKLREILATLTLLSILKIVSAAEIFRILCVYLRNVGKFLIGLRSSGTGVVCPQRADRPIAP